MRFSMMAFYWDLESDPTARTGRLPLNAALIFTSHADRLSASSFKNDFTLVLFFFSVLFAIHNPRSFHRVLPPIRHSDAENSDHWGMTPELRTTGPVLTSDARLRCFTFFSWNCNCLDDLMNGVFRNIFTSLDLYSSPWNTKSHPLGFPNLQQPSSHTTTHT